MKQVPFQLEKDFPGTFLIQGVLGGVLGGFLSALIAAIAWRETYISAILELTFLTVFTGGIIGMIKATVMWGVYRLAGIQLRALARVTATSIIASLFIAVIGLRYEFDETFLPGCLVWALSVGIPVALLVGSRIKPWEIFTFGSIAVGDAFDQRSGSRSILRTLCIFPLRFLSIGTLALWLLYLASQTKGIHLPGQILGGFLIFVIVGAYPFFSAYVTFRSPRKTVLLACGVILNIPIAFIGLFYYGLYDKAYWLGEAPLIISAFCGLFVAAWLIFLVARLSVRINPAPSPTISNKSIADAPNLGHECLGSRFVAWQHHEA